MTHPLSEAGTSVEVKYTAAQKLVYDKLAQEGGGTWATYMMMDIEAAFQPAPDDLRECYCGGIGGGHMTSCPENALIQPTPAETEGEAEAMRRLEHFLSDTADGYVNGISKHDLRIWKAALEGRKP